MKTCATLLAAVLLALVNASAAQAGTKIMASGPASRLYPTLQELDCNILSANKVGTSVTIDVMDYVGNVVTTSGPLFLSPFTGATVTDTSFDGAWCRFTVDGNPKKFRATAAYRNGTSYTTVNPAN